LLFLIDFIAAWRAGHRLWQAIDQLQDSLRQLFHSGAFFCGLKSGMRPAQRLGILIKIKFRWCSVLL
jgi:hypothetical protein